MTQALLNGTLLPLEEARISPMDRGFLFADGIYEVIPTHEGHFIGFDAHMERLETGLEALSIPNPHNRSAWRRSLEALLHANGSGSLGVYLQVTRGEFPRRQHRFPEACSPTVFAYTFAIPTPGDGNPETAFTFSVATTTDLRWQRCHIKSIALLGNVLHMMDGINAGADEVLLFNDRDELTEAAACNVFVVSQGEVATPALDHQKLPGITRNLLLDMMRRAGDWQVSERCIQRREVLTADEVWLSSSTKELAPVTVIDGKPVGDGTPGPVWSRAQALFDRHRFDY